MDLMWKQDIAVPIIQRNSWNSSDERRVRFGQDSAPYYKTLQARSAFQSCPRFSDILGGWCVSSSSVCCSQTILNVKYCWVPFSIFSTMEYYFLLMNDGIQFLGVTFVSVSCLEGHSLFNDVSSLLFLLSRFCHLCIPPVYIRIPRETQIRGFI